MARDQPEQQAPPVQRLRIRYANVPVVAAMRGLALGGIAAVGQLQLFQPFMGLGLAALFLHEEVSMAMLLASRTMEFLFMFAPVDFLSGPRRPAPRE